MHGTSKFGVQLCDFSTCSFNKFQCLWISEERNKTTMFKEEDLPLEEEELPPRWEERCRRFARLHCQDFDLLHISRMIAKEGDSLDAVGVCLQVDSKVVSDIEKNDMCPKLQDKMHKILREWGWKNTRNATWATLIKGLQALNDQKLMEHIQEYLSEKEYPMIGMLTYSFDYQYITVYTFNKLPITALNAKYVAHVILVHVKNAKNCEQQYIKCNSSLIDWRIK